MNDNSEGLWSEYRAWWARVCDRTERGLTPARFKLLGMVSVLWLVVLTLMLGL